MNQDRHSRRLARATAGLRGRYAPWGAAMRAELSTIDDGVDRAEFAREAIRTAAVRGLRGRLLTAAGVALAVAGVVVVASRLQWDTAQPGVLSATVPLPALLIFGVAAVTAWITHSFPAGLESGLLSAAGAFVAMAVALAIEGQAWMDEHGVFILDGDPPLEPAGPLAVAADLFTTGMWIGHVVVWSIALVAGAGLGTALRAATHSREKATTH